MERRSSSYRITMTRCLTKEWGDGRPAPFYFRPYQQIKDPRNSHWIHDKDANWIYERYKEIYSVKERG